MLKRILTICGIAVSVIALIIVLVLWGHSARAIKKLDNRAALYADAFRAATELMSDAGILPPFNEVKIIEEYLLYDISTREESERIVEAIDEACPYPVSLSPFLDHYDEFMNDLINEYYEDYALVSITSARRPGYNRILLEVFFRKRSEDRVYLYYTHRRGAWILLDAGIVDMRPAHGQARDPDRTWYMDEHWKLHKE